MEKLEIYSRGQTYGFQDTLTGKKYRLKTLELEEEFSQMTHIFENKASKHQEQKLQGTKKHQKENKQQRQSKEQEQNQQQKKKENLGTHEKIKKSDEDKEIKKDNFAKRFFRKRIKEAQKANTKTKEKDNDFSKE